MVNPRDVAGNAEEEKEEEYSFIIISLPSRIIVIHWLSKLMCTAVPAKMTKSDQAIMPRLTGSQPSCPTRRLCHDCSDHGHIRPGAGIMEADDRQVTTVFLSPTVIPPSVLDKPSIMKRTVVGLRAVTPHLVASGDGNAS